MIRALIVLALLLAPEWQVVKGKRFDVFARKKAEAARLAPGAEETAKRFEELLGTFPGDRAAVVVRHFDDPGDAGDPAWPEFGADWVFTETVAHVLHIKDIRSADPRTAEEARLDRFRRALAVELLVRWSDLEAPDPPRGDGSGTRLPDWWEDAVAGWSEGARSREGRRLQFRAIRSLGKALPLEDMLGLLRDRDPGYATIPPVALDPKDLPSDLPPEVLEALREMRMLPVLPAQSLAFIEYLVEDEGLPFVRHLARVLAEGHGMKNALPWLEKNPKERKYPKSLAPRTVRELEIAWKARLDARGR